MLDMKSTSLLPIVSQELFFSACNFVGQQGSREINILELYTLVK